MIKIVSYLLCVILLAACVRYTRAPEPVESPRPQSAIKSRAEVTVTTDPGHCNSDQLALQQLLLNKLNEARATSRRCGAKHFNAAPPLEWNHQLELVAHRHSMDMSRQDFFDHKGSDGSTVASRADRADYRWSRIGENIAAGQHYAAEALDGWLKSASHCRNIMSPAFTDTAAACISNSDSEYSYYWTNVFGQQSNQ